MMISAFFRNAAPIRQHMPKEHDRIGSTEAGRVVYLISTKGYCGPPGNIKIRCRNNQQDKRTRFIVGNGSERSLSHTCI